MEVVEATPQAEPAFDDQLQSLAGELADSLRTVLNSTTMAALAPKDLARELKLDITLVSRLLRALRADNPLHSVHVMPGTLGVDAILRALARRGAEAGVLTSARRALAAFDAFVRNEIGSRSALEAVLKGLVPEARRSTELKSKQAIFRGMGQLLGCETRAHVIAVICKPGADPLRYDALLLHGSVGFRLLNPRATVSVGFFSASCEGTSIQTTDGSEIQSGQRYLLTEFCSHPLPHMEPVSTPRGVRYDIRPDRARFGSEASFFFATVARSSGLRCRQSDQVWDSHAIMVMHPARVLQLDVYLHDSLWPGVSPELWIGRGLHADSQYSRDSDYSPDDRLDLLETITPLGRGMLGVSSAEMRDYPAMVRAGCRLVGWDGEQFRGFRCVIRYPVVGSYVSFRYRLPDRAD